MAAIKMKHLDETKKMFKKRDEAEVISDWIYAPMWVVMCAKLLAALADLLDWWLEKQGWQDDE